MKSKQIRISEADYNALSQLCEKLGRSKAEVLENLICLGDILAENDVGSIKIVCDNEERQIMLPVLSRRKHAD